MLTHALVGLDARRVEVEAHVELGNPAFAIVGLADRACQEAKHRVRSGIASAELFWPATRRILGVMVVAEVGGVPVAGTSAGGAPEPAGRRR